jgi:hypothetical protein
MLDRTRRQPRSAAAPARAPASKGRRRVVLVLSTSILAGGAVLAALVLVRPEPAMVQALTARAASYAEVAAADPARLRIHRLTDVPGVLIFDYPSYMAQAVALNRVAALVEKRHLPRDRIVARDELDRYIRARGGRYITFYYGHNYDPGELARFFGLAAADGVALTPGERDLRRALLAEDVIRETADGVAPGAGAAYVVSLVAADAPDVAPEFGERARRVALAHELGHAWYAVNAPYRRYARAFWYDAMTDGERAAFRGFLARRSYDTSNEALVIDEAQAFLAFTPDAGVVNDDALGLPQGRLAQLRARFRPPVRPPWTGGG